MRGKELNGVKILDVILKCGKLKLRGTPDSIFEKFNIVNDKEKCEVDIYSPISSKTIERLVSEFLEEGILEKDQEGYYSINASYFVTPKSLHGSEWKKVLNELLENNELDAYRFIRNNMGGVHQDYELLDNVELNRYSETIKESVHILSNHQEVIRKINTALTESRQIKVSYKGKECELYPVCYVVSRDGTRKYLYGIRRKKLLPPMELSELNFLDMLEKKDIDKEFYKRQIQNAWDIDVQPPHKIKVMVRKDMKDSRIVNRKIHNYLGKPIEENEKFSIYEGDITGINDFKTWLRSYIEVCIVLQPDDLREEFINSLQEKYRRYGGRL